MPKLKQNQDAADRQRGASNRWPAMEMALRMNTLLASSCRRVLEFQHDVAGFAIAETSAYQGELMRAMSAVAQYSWPHIHQQDKPRIVEVTRAWFDLVSQTQAAMIQVLRDYAVDRGQRMPAVPTRDMGALFERRRKAVVINFPERRAA